MTDSMLGAILFYSSTTGAAIPAALLRTLLLVGIGVYYLTDVILRRR